MLKNRPQLAGTLVGAGVTAISTTAFFFVAQAQRMELQAYDARVRLANTIEASPLIVHIDIDDGALERVGRWPWRRDQLADLTRALHELGAEYIMIDLLLSEPELPYSRNPLVGRNADVEPEIEVVGELSEQNLVYGDLEFADAIRSAGNVIMAVQLSMKSPDEPEPLDRQLRALLASRPGLTAEDARRQLDLPDSPEDLAEVSRELLRLRAFDELMSTFSLTERELAERLFVDVDDLEAVIAGTKRAAALELVGRLFSNGSTPSLKEVCSKILGPRGDRMNADRQDLLNAYRATLGLVQLDRMTHPLPADIFGNLHRAAAAVPLYFLFAESALDIAAVNFMFDDDGAVRRVPILAQYKGQGITHLGLTAAARILDLDIGSLSMPNARRLRIPRRSGGDLIVPLDGKGNLLLPWSRTGTQWRAGRDFEHISVAKVWSLVDARRRIASNDTMIDYLLADIVAASKGELTIDRSDSGATSPTSPTTTYADHVYRNRVNEYLDLRRKTHLSRLRRDRTHREMAILKRQADSILKAIQQERDLAISSVQLNMEEILQIPDSELDGDPELKKDVERLTHAWNLIEKDIPALQRANETLAQTATKLESQLAEKIKGKYVFFGYAATAEGDIVSTPIDANTNGVMCHANVLNAFLQNRFLVPAPPWIEILVCLILGTLAGWITATRAPPLALALTALLMLIYAVFNVAVLFKIQDIWFALIPIVFTMFLSWAFVTLFRQLTAERDKRLFRKQLSQYTSPAIAARIAESPDAAQAFKAVQTRDVTCFFSDLKGFTAITEAENPERVQYVLNTYLERMSRVIWDRRGLINKFMGDGIMAFFNPSVDPLTEHPHVACDTALEAFAELERLKHDEAGASENRIFDRLEMRIGLASGLCKNGDLGSELKADYTVIGDVVNLAARLEPANKVFGTQIMVSGPLRDLVVGDYEFRCLADLQVKGKTHTVPVYEIVCRKGELTDEQRQYIDRFEAGVELYKRRKWDDCIVHFTRILARRPDDPGASRYIDACQELKTFPPDDDWNGALELKEK